MAVTAQTGLVAQRFSQGLPQGDANIFNRMVRIDVQIALRFNFKVDHPMAGDLIEHVIEKWHARGELTPAAAIKIYADRNPGFEGISANFGLPHEGPANTWSLNAN